jgi:dTDP-4-dehydrorhamnose reductase
LVSFGPSIRFDPLIDKLDIVKSYDYVINCIGTIKPFMSSNPRDARYLNSVLPWDLANICEKYGNKLIHITTDCVFSGKKGNYIETDTHDALDDYGKSKSLGEPTNALVIRTSIIGEEIHKNASLIEWAKSQKEKQVRGFTNHLWNGITTNQYAQVCNNIIDNNLWEKGLFHVYSPTAVNKLQMMEYFNNKWLLNLKIEPFETPEKCDRSLCSEKLLCNALQIPELKYQIDVI